MHKRPVVLFDATNADHRKWFANFVQNRTWSGCPVHFEATDANGNLSQNITVAVANQVAAYYLNQEFKKKSQRAPRGAKAI